MSTKKKAEAKGQSVGASIPASTEEKKARRARGRERANVVVNGPQSGKPPTLSAGTVLTRVYRGKKVIVKVLGPREFEYGDKRYTSLSALACEISKSHCSGPRWFGLVKPANQKARGKK